MFEGLELFAAFLLIVTLGPRVLVRIVRRMQKREKAYDPFSEQE